jgi:hypothetical protein
MQTQTDEEKMQTDTQGEPNSDQASDATSKSKPKPKPTNNLSKKDSQNSNTQLHTAPNDKPDISATAKSGKPCSPVATTEQDDQNVNKKLKFRAQSSSPSKEHRPRSSKGPGGTQQMRAPKGSKDAIQSLNKFASLADYELDGVAPSDDVPKGSRPLRKPTEAP